MRILLPSAQPDERLRFYTEGLQLAIERSWDDPGNRGWLVRAVDGAYVEILAANDTYQLGAPSGVQLVLQVGDVDRVVERLRAFGVTVQAEPTDQSWGSRTAQVVDPEGLLVNLFTPAGTPDEP